MKIYRFKDVFLYNGYRKQIIPDRRQVLFPTFVRTIHIKQDFFCCDLDPVIFQSFSYGDTRFYYKKSEQELIAFPWAYSIKNLPQPILIIISGTVEVKICPFWAGSKDLEIKFLADNLISFRNNIVRGVEGLVAEIHICNLRWKQA